MGWTIWIFSGAILALLAVAGGAFGSHALKGIFSPEKVAVFETAVRYQMYHALALIALGLVATRVENYALKIAGVCFVLGTILFSGSLYLITMTDQRAIGFLTPIGGLLFLIGWACFAFSVLKLS